MNTIPNNTILTPPALSYTENKTYEVMFLIAIMMALLLIGVGFFLLNLGAPYLRGTVNQDSEESKIEIQATV